MTLRFERMVAGIIVMMVVLVSSPVLAQAWGLPLPHLARHRAIRCHQSIFVRLKLVNAPICRRLWNAMYLTS